jgi:hypothetical protein
VAFDQSGRRWLGISDLIAEPEGPTFISYKVARSLFEPATLRDTRPTTDPGGLPEHALARIAKGDGFFLSYGAGLSSLACITFNGAIVPVDGGLSSSMIRLCPEFFSHSVPVER